MKEDGLSKPSDKILLIIFTEIKILCCQLNFHFRLNSSLLTFVHKSIRKLNLTDMLDAPIAPGANLFIWIVLIIVGLVHWIIIADTYGKKKKKEKSH